MREPFFSKDKKFYQGLRQMLILTILHNLITQSISLIDNLMLAFYSSSSVAGVTAVNQISFLVQQFALSFGTSLVIIASRFWGEKKTDPIRTLTGSMLRFSVAFGLVLVLICSCFAGPIIGFFTNSGSVIEEAQTYLNVIKWSYPLFMASMIFACALRSVGSARTGFQASLTALIVNVILNYVLIFGRLGFPRLGVAGAAIATLISRAVELAVFVWNLAVKDTKMRLFSKLCGSGGFFGRDTQLEGSLVRVALPVTIGTMLWSFAAPTQTSVISALSKDAFAANSAISTLFQYFKVVIAALSSVSVAQIGNAVGAAKPRNPSGGAADNSELRARARSISLLALIFGLALGLLFLALREPLLMLSGLTGTARTLTGHMMLILSAALVGMSWQMTVNDGILLGYGDIGFVMANDLISVWIIAIPLAVLAAFKWRLPAEAVIALLYSDQFFKCFPVFLRFRHMIRRSYD